MGSYYFFFCVYAAKRRQGNGTISILVFSLPRVLLLIFTMVLGLLLGAFLPLRKMLHKKHSY
jgi:hypothetical protein